MNTRQLIWLLFALLSIALGLAGVTGAVALGARSTLAGEHSGDLV